MATQVQVPTLGESVTQAILVKWFKEDGQAVTQDEAICELETDKANVDVPAPTAGVLRRVKNEGDTVAIGDTIARIEEGGGNSNAKPAARQAPNSQQSAQSKAKPEDLRPSVRRLVDEKQLNAADIK